MNAPFIPPTATVEPFRFTVDQFLALHEQGLFEGYTKSELIEGEIVVMNAQWSRHARVKSRLANRLANALSAMGSALEPQVEVSIRLSDGSLPEPDITLTAYRGDGAVPLADVAERIPSILAEIQAELYVQARAFLEGHTLAVTDRAAFLTHCKNRSGCQQLPLLANQ